MKAVISQVELLAAQERVIDAQLALRQAQTVLRMNIVAVYRSLGVGSDQKMVTADHKQKEAADI